MKRVEPPAWVMTGACATARYAKPERVAPPIVSKSPTTYTSIPLAARPARLTLADGESDRWGFGFHAGSIVPGPEVLSRTSGALVSPEAVVTDPPAKRLVPLTAITVTEPLTKSGCKLGSVTPVPKVLTRAKPRSPPA